MANPGAGGRLGKRGTNQPVRQKFYVISARAFVSSPINGIFPHMLLLRLLKAAASPSGMLEKVVALALFFMMAMEE